MEGQTFCVLSRVALQLKKEHYSSSKIDKIIAFFRNLSRFHEIITKN